jgi:hypothetical protein
VALVVAGAAVWLATRGSPSPRTGGPGPSPRVSPTVPGRALFLFPIQFRKADRTGKANQSAADDATVAVASRLSTFYDTVFVNPDTWANGVPDDAWSIFDPSIVDRAKKDADAFTLGDQAAGLAKLKVKGPSLFVKVLLTPSGQPDTAIAEAEFVAVGTLDGGGKVDITNHVSFLLRPQDGRWTVVGYQDASTDVQSQTEPSAGPSPSGTASP